MKQFFTVFLSVFFLGGVLGCSIQNEESDYITVVDLVGDEVKVKQNPENVAVIARAAADMMVGFGLGDRVDGMYSSILDNSWTEFIYPDVSEYYSYGYNESAELFLSRGVDLVFAPERHIAESLRADGVTAITVSLYGTPKYEDVLYNIADLIAQIWPETAEYVNEWKHELDLAINDITTTLTNQDAYKQRTIHYVRGDKDRGIGYTDTKGSLVETVYENYFGFTYLGSQFENNRPSIEEIMFKNPDVIVVGGAYQNTIIDGIYGSEPQNLLDAVSNDQLFNIPIGFVMWEQNSMALPLFIYDQANKLYPEYFNYDMETLTKDIFYKYFGVELTNDQIDFMLTGRSYQGDHLAS